MPKAIRACLLSVLIAGCAAQKAAAPPAAAPAPAPAPKLRPAFTAIPDGWGAARGAGGKPLKGAFESLVNPDLDAVIFFYVGDAAAGDEMVAARSHSEIIAKIGAELSPIEREPGRAGFAWAGRGTTGMRAGAVHAWRMREDQGIVIAAVGEWPLEANDEAIDDFMKIIEGVTLR